MKGWQRVFAAWVVANLVTWAAFGMASIPWQLFFGGMAVVFAVAWWLLGSDRLETDTDILRRWDERYRCKQDHG